MARGSWLVCAGLALLVGALAAVGQKRAGKPAILVTGGAGFIGSHLSKALQASGEYDVVAIDSFNSYYNPALKWKRVEALLQPTGVRVVDGDVCDDALISSLMAEYDFITVYHLAAQAGVRYSMKKPQAYVKENVQCFVALLEQIRAVGEAGRPMPRLLYASSSSVYGLSENIPFSETDRVDKLSNLYGATKRMNENTAFAYHNLFNISSIGFRFFTVYGPWGRPDMAAYLFSDQILRGEPITVFNEGKLRRDFTYIDDIVAGLVAANKVAIHKPIAINLGNNKPVEVMSFISLLESLLGKKANIQWAVSRAEMPVTFANISLAQSMLHYDPKTSIDTGLAAFVKWYKDYERQAVPCESECAVDTPDMCFRSGWAAAAAASREFTKECSAVVYSATLSSPMSFTPWQYKVGLKNGGQVCAVLFVKAGSLKAGARRRRLSQQWKIIEVAGLMRDLSDDRLLRIVKLTPGAFFAPQVEHAVFVHPKLELRMSLGKLLELLKPTDVPSSHKVSMMVVRNEQAQRDAPGSNGTFSGALARQVSAYEKYSAAGGVCLEEFFFDDALVVHDLRSPAAKRVRCEWYREFQQWSDHDQVAGAFALAHTAVEAGGTATCARMRASHALSADEQLLVPISKASKTAQVEYVRMLPNKHYHWHFTENLAKEVPKR